MVPSLFGHTSVVSESTREHLHGFRVMGRTLFCAADSVFFWLFFATAYITPAKKPTEMADTEPSVTASPKKIMPDAATGSLFRAPTMLNVVFIEPRARHDTRNLLLPVRGTAGYTHTPCSGVRDSHRCRA